MAKRIDGTIAAGLLLAVVFTALAHGAVEAWSVAAFELVVVALLALWAVKMLLDGRVRVMIPGAALPVAALLVLGLAQSVAVTGGYGRRLSLSKDVEATRGAVTVLFYLLASLVVAANFFNTRQRLQALARFLIIYGLALAVFALVQHFAWNGRFYWLRPNTQTVSPFGPFASHNQFAGYMEMLMPIPVALVVARVVRGEALVFYLFAAAVMGLTVIVSLSRGGMIGLSAAMIFLAVAGLRRRARPDDGQAVGKEKKGWMRRAIVHPASPVIIVFALIAAGVFLTAPEAIIKRVTDSLLSDSHGAETFYISRGWIWQDTFSMIRANPITGVGLGAYKTAHPIYSHADGSLTVSHAHNDYLQALSDGGILGGIIAAWFIVTVARATARGLRSSDPLLRGLALGGGAGLFALLVHSVLDFNLQIPSNALLFLLLTAVVSNAGAMATDPEAEITRAARRRAHV